MSALANAQPAAVDDLVLVLGTLVPPHRHAPGGEIRAHVRVVDRPLGQGLAEPVVEADAGPQPFAQVGRQVLRVAAVVEDEPILGVEDGDAVGDAFGRGQEACLAGERALFRLAPRRDVGGQQDPPPIGHGRLADPHPAAVDMAVLALAGLLAAGCQAALAIVGAHLRVIDRAERQAFADPVAEADSQAQTAPAGRAAAVPAGGCCRRRSDPRRRG